MYVREGRYKIALVVEYDGTRYRGFQYQAGAATIQGELEQAISRLTRERRRIAAASRTDSGVHARGQVASFRIEAAYASGVFVNGLNFYLPEDVVVREAHRIPDDFDVRRRAISREYRYYIHNDPVRAALGRAYTHQVRQPLDTDAMAKAAADLCGTHDFASFVTSYEKGSTVRMVQEASVARTDSLVVFRMIARSFLPHQVRNTVGSLIRVGLGKVGVDHIRHLLEAKQVALAGPTAPACGLVLEGVNYAQPLGAMG